MNQTQKDKLAQMCREQRIFLETKREQARYAIKDAEDRLTSAEVGLRDAKAAHKHYDDLLNLLGFMKYEILEARVQTEGEK